MKLNHDIKLIKHILAQEWEYQRSTAMPVAIFDCLSRANCRKFPKLGDYSLKESICIYEKPIHHRYILNDELKHLLRCTKKVGIQTFLNNLANESKNERAGLINLNKRLRKLMNFDRKKLAAELPKVEEELIRNLPTLQIPLYISFLVERGLIKLSLKKLQHHIWGMIFP